MDDVMSDDGDSTGGTQGSEIRKSARPEGIWDMC